MTQSRTKHEPKLQATIADPREAQESAFRRNQALALVALAAGVCLWWLFHTNPKWIQPVGWWRL